MTRCIAVGPLAAVWLVLLIGVLGCGTASIPPGGETLVLQGATILDGHGGAPLPDATVVIQEDRITAVGPRGTIAVPRGATIEDVSGHFLLPGLIDIHAHALVPYCDGRGFDWEMSRNMMRALLHAGVTTARSPATPTALGVAMRDSLRAGAFPGPRLLVAGELINGPAMTPGAVRAEVRSQIAAGVDFIKLYSALDPEAVRAGIDEAHRLGRPVIGHLERTSWIEALAMGVDQLTHVTSWTDDLLPRDRRAAVSRMRDRDGPMHARIDWLEAFASEGEEVDSLIALLVAHQVSIDPTLVALDTKFTWDSLTGRSVAARYRRNPAREVVPGLPARWDSCGTPTDTWVASDFDRVATTWPKLLRLAKRYHDGGVLLTAGSDTPNPWVIPGEGLHRELELLVDAGIDPSAVIRIATRNGAAALGLLDDLGTIEPGKRADLILLDADPLADIRHTRRLVWVMWGGTRYPFRSSP